MQDIQEEALDCNFDGFLKYFLYRVLEQNSDANIRLDELQEKIEGLQQQVDRHSKNEDEKQQTTAGLQELEKSRRGDPVEGAGSFPSSGQEGAFDALKATEELHTLTAQRDQQLDKLLDDCLSAVLPICNAKNSPLRRHLGDYCSQKDGETERFAPYVLACNYALDCMKDLQNLPLRPPSSLNLCFHRSDPKLIKSTYSGTSASVDRNPDVIGTSTVAAQDNSDADYTHPPKEAFSWAQTLFPNEIKMDEMVIPYDSSQLYTKDRFVKAECAADELHTVYGLNEGTPILESESKRSAKRQKLGPEAVGPASSSKKRGSTSKSAKRSKGSTAATTSGEKTTTIPVNTQKAAVDARTQCALYGLEMMSYDLGIHHAIVLLFVDSYLWIWYCDRQGIIQSNGINFIQDLPRFLVLLLAFQRFELEDWGVIKALNPSVELAHSRDENLPPLNKKTRTNSADGRRARARRVTEIHFDPATALALPPGYPAQRIIINTDDILSHKPHCLPGRATAVYSASAPDSNLVELACKIYHPEVIRQNEGEMLGLIYDIVKQNNPSMKKHLPNMLFYGDLPACTTLRIRSMMGIKWQGHRTTRFVVFKKIQPLTTLVGPEFVKSWLEVVKCHAFLWKHGIEHGDPSLWNIMYNDRDGCGVLADYDLSVVRYLPRVLGSDRAGTIPFMAIRLLEDDYWKGEIQRLFHHELEALIWILPFVFLRYQDRVAQNNTPVDSWLTSDYNTCRAAKWEWANHLRIQQAGEKVQEDFRNEWPLAVGLVKWALKMHNQRIDPDLEEPVSTMTDLEGVWKEFLTQLKLTSKYPGLQYIERFVDVLGLEDLLVAS